jgi:hypothetical protein
MREAHEAHETDRRSLQDEVRRAASQSASQSREKEDEMARTTAAYEEKLRRLTADLDALNGDVDVKKRALDNVLQRVDRTRGESDILRQQLVKAEEDVSPTGHGSAAAEAERGLLGALMLEFERAWPSVEASGIGAGDFTEPAHREFIWLARNKSAFQTRLNTAESLGAKLPITLDHETDAQGEFYLSYATKVVERLKQKP